MRYSFHLEANHAAFGVSYNDDLHVGGLGIAPNSYVGFPLDLSDYKISWFLSFDERSLQSKFLDMLRVAGKTPSPRAIDATYWADAHGYMHIFEPQALEINLKATRGRGLEQLLITTAMTGHDLIIGLPSLVIADKENAPAPSLSAFADRGEPLVFHQPVHFYPKAKGL